ncbi:MAG: hypothetical protein OXE57_01125 [Alphaproteobacteria bacterium]|nr:hypothetical protein [Alphaproteobacteria bacterium]
MRWPWQKRPPERRESGGDFADAVLRLIESEASGTAASSTSTAAVEAAAGALSRAFASARVEGPDWTREAVTGDFLAQCGRDLVRKGDSLHAIRMSAGGVRLIPCASWHWEGSHDPEAWTVRATAYGPSTSTTWNLPASSVVFLRWGGEAGQPYIGTGPTRWASVTARLHAQAERSLADEAAGPVGSFIPYPPSDGQGEDEDPTASLQADIAKARGKAMLVETTQAGNDQGRSAAPMKDWHPERLGPNMPAAMVELARDGFMRTLAACGTPPDLFAPADGTAQREAVRRWHLGTVMPLARLLEDELSRKLEAKIGLRFDAYPLDLAGRAQSFQKFVAGGMDVDRALALTGLLADEDT